MAIKPKKEEKFIVPGWMVSFSDMIVNLMCFFILLVTMGQKQESGFFGAGSGEYTDDILAEGKPGLMPSGRTLIQGDTKSSRHDAPKINPVEKAHWADLARADMHDEFDRLARSRSRIDDPKRSFPIPMGIRFDRGSAALNATDRQQLALLAPAIAAREDLLEVVAACAKDECSDARRTLQLSYERALVVVDVLRAAGVPARQLIPFGVGEQAPDGVADAEPVAQNAVALRWRLTTDG